MRNSIRRSLGGLAVGTLLLGGCGFSGANDLPLPGAVSGDDTYRVSMIFTDATNLVPKETCRTNDTIVGSVESVELDEDLRAEVVCVIRDTVTLPANTVATLRETSLLGERFVSLDPPTGEEGHGALRAGAVVPQSSTRVDPNAEMVLGALSQLLNGGSLGTVQTISQELSTALEGSDFAETTRQLRVLVGRLNGRRSDITASLDAIDRLAGRLADQRTVLAAALDSVPDGLAVLDRQRPQLTRTLKALDRLSRVAVPLIERSKANTVADLEHLEPVLRQLSTVGDELALSLERFVSFPFPNTFLATAKGDYAGMYASITLDLESLAPLLVPRGTEPGSPPPALAGDASTPPLLDGLLGNLLGQTLLPGLASLLPLGGGAR
ncbi:MCE family protein [Nocardioides sp. WS12]|uniref:MCE family protein n=1 Tax=Nocardioides sp. WS12 TaxID=2486272 RepID=UPI0015FB6737|nr:MCE family protein [Nocardioides sp. WS12]